MDVEELVTQALQALVGRNLDAFRSYCAPDLLAIWKRADEETGAEDDWPFLDYGIVDVENAAQDDSQVVHAAVKMLAPWRKADKVYGAEGINSPTAVHEVALSVRDGEILSIDWREVHWQEPAISMERWLWYLRQLQELRLQHPEAIAHAIYFCDSPRQDETSPQEAQ